MRGIAMKYAILLLAVLFVFAVVGYQIQGALSELRVTSEEAEPVQLPSEARIHSATTQLAAVDDAGNGLLMPLTVELKTGNGKVLVNIDNPSFIFDTQESMRLAVKEAGRISGYNTSTTDVIFSFGTNATIVGGPSAGAAMTIATIAALEGRSVRDDVAITGRIGDGGLVLPVGGIKEKALAAQQAGIRVFLIPKGEGLFSEPSQNCTEKRTGNSYEKRCFITNTYVNVTDIVKGIDVREVATIEEALQYMVY
jgi:uncharacterized protein